MLRLLGYSDFDFDFDFDFDPDFDFDFGHTKVMTDGL